MIDYVVFNTFLYFKDHMDSVLYHLIIPSNV